MPNSFYEIPINVEAGEQCGMPNDMKGAYVNCYAGAKNVNEALHKCVDALRDKGYIFRDVLDQAMELDPEKWTNFVDEAWPEVNNSFPTQREVKNNVINGDVFFGPFVGYSSNKKK